MTRRDEATEKESVVRFGGRHQLHDLDAVVDLVPEGLQRPADIRYRGGVMTTRRRTPRTDDGERRSPCSAESTRLATEATTHVAGCRSRRPARAALRPASRAP